MHYQSKSIRPPGLTTSDYTDSTQKTDESMEFNVTSRDVARNSQYSQVDTIRNIDLSNDIQRSVDCCFICSVELSHNSRRPIKSDLDVCKPQMLAILSNVLGYKLENVFLHSNFVCPSCYEMANTINALQQQLTMAETNIRTKFLDTFRNLSLKYERTDEFLNKNLVGKTKERKKLINIDPHTSKEVQDPSFCSIVDQDKNIPEPINTPEDCLLHTEETQNKFIYDSLFPFTNKERLKIGVVHENKCACSFCSNMQSNENSLTMHVRAIHLPTFVYDEESLYGSVKIGVKLQAAGAASSSIGDRFCCLLCDQSFVFKHMLALHFKEMHRIHPTSI